MFTLFITIILKHTHSIMITSNPTHTLSVAIDVESLLKMVYAESAWRYFSQIAENQTSVLLDNDRRAIVIP